MVYRHVLLFIRIFFQTESYEPSNYFQIVKCFNMSNSFELKAAKPEHANILVWQEQYAHNQASYKQIDTLRGHDLTIVQMKFSNSGDYLLSVSRDRSWKLFRRRIETNNNATQFQFELARSIGTKNPYHTRIIWSCDWSHDDKFFATTSRDKRACIWSSADHYSEEEKPFMNQSNQKPYLELESPITTCSFAPCLTSDSSYLIAFGLETGKIVFYKWVMDTGFSFLAQVEDK